MGGLFGAATSALHLGAGGVFDPCRSGQSAQMAWRLLQSGQLAVQGVQVGVNVAQGKWISALADLLKACFAAGTPLLTPEGHNDNLLTRNPTMIISS